MDILAQTVAGSDTLLQSADGKPLTSPLTGLLMSSPELKPNNLVRSLVLEALNKAAHRTPRQTSQGRG